MYFTLFSVVCLLLLATVMTVHIYRGYKRGFSASLLALGIAVLSLFVALVASSSIAEAVSGPILKLISTAEFFVEIEASMPSLISLLLALLKILLALVIYVPAFFLSRLLFSLIIRLVQRCIMGKGGTRDTAYISEDEEAVYKHSRRCGALISIATGYLATLVLLMPLIGTLSVTGDILRIVDSYTMTGAATEDTANETDRVPLTVASDDPADETVTEPLWMAIEPYEKDVCKTILGYCGADQLFDLVARTELAGESISLKKEIRAIQDFDINAIIALFEQAESIGDEELQTLADAIDAMDESVFVKFTVAGVLSTAADTWLRGEDYFGMNRPTFGNDQLVDPFIVEILKVCRTTTHRTITADMTTLLNVFGHLSGINDMLASGAYEDLINELTTNGTLGRIEDELRKNTHMSYLATTLHEMAIRLVVSELTETLSDENYDRFVTNISDALNNVRLPDGSIPAEELATQMQGYLSDYNIDVPTSVTQDIAESVAKKLEDTSRITPEVIEELFAEYLSGANIEDFEGIEGVLPDDFGGILP